MINMNKLVEDARLARLEAEATEMRSKIKRREGNTWLADMLDMDAKFAAEEAAMLFGKVMLIVLRKREIDEFESATGVEFDARNMDVPKEKLITWWQRSQGGTITMSQEN